MVAEQNVKLLSRDRIHRVSKKIARKLVKECGGIDGAAANCRIRRSALADAGNVNVDNRYLPVDVMLSLETTIGRPIALQFLAHELGFVVMRIPAQIPEAIWQKHLNRTVRKSSRLFKHVIDALRDDDITVEEAEGLLKQTDATLEAIASLRGALVERIQRGPTRTPLRKAG